jgi:hypothetical protein
MNELLMVPLEFDLRLPAPHARLLVQVSSASPEQLKAKTCCLVTFRLNKAGRLFHCQLPRC